MISLAVFRWDPQPMKHVRQEKLFARLGKHRKLFLFLYEQRRAIFDEAFQEELATMYRTTGEGSQPVPPALLAMVILLQA